MQFNDVRILVCLGTGGVGKTTVAASLGYLAAESGLKTLVMTVDPSRRLAQTLGIGNRTDVVKVATEKKLPLFATVIDHKKVFDEFLGSAAKAKDAAQKLLSNRLYQELSTTLSGSQEFTCLEVLYRHAKSGKYDLIILDTPPASHAVDFLRAPERLADLFQQDVIQWLMQEGGRGGFFKKVFQQGTQKVLSLLEAITGSEFIGSLKDFFISLGPWSRDLAYRTQQFRRLLVEPTTHFYLVTAPDKVSLTEAKFLAAEVSRGGYHLETIIFNRAKAPWKTHVVDDSSAVAADLEKQFKLFKSYFETRRKDVEDFLRQLPRKTKGLLLPEFTRDISNLETLQEFSRIFTDDKNV